MLFSHPKCRDSLSHKCLYTLFIIYNIMKWFNEHNIFKIYGVDELEWGWWSSDRETLICCYITCPYGPSSASVASTVAIIIGGLSSGTNIVFWYGLNMGALSLMSSTINKKLWVMKFPSPKWPSVKVNTKEYSSFVCKKNQTFTQTNMKEFYYLLCIFYLLHDLIRFLNKY